MEPIVREGFIVTFCPTDGNSRRNVYVPTYEKALNMLESLVALRYENLQLWQSVNIPADHPACTKGNSNFYKEKESNGPN